MPVYRAGKFIFIGQCVEIILVVNLLTLCLRLMQICGTVFWRQINIRSLRIVQRNGRVCCHSADFVNSNRLWAQSRVHCGCKTRGKLCGWPWTSLTEVDGSSGTFMLD